MFIFNSFVFNFSGCAELVKSTIFPSTANEVDKQYVCITLEAKLPDGYPDEEPIIQLRNPRGLDDSTINHLYESIKDKCTEFIGQPVIYELIEVKIFIVPIWRYFKIKINESNVQNQLKAHTFFTVTNTYLLHQYKFNNLTVPNSFNISNQLLIAVNLNCLILLLL